MGMTFKKLTTRRDKIEFLAILEERRISETKNMLKEHDNAFINSLLSHAVYSGRQWTLEFINNHPSHLLDANHSQKKLIEMIKDTPEDLTSRKAYEIYMATYLKDTFELVTLPVQSGTYHSQKFGYKTEIHAQGGDYEALNNLARAGVFRSKNPDGSYTLHVAFRGTDTGARPFMDFAKLAYTDVAAYSDCFKPLEDALIQYVSNKNNQITQVHLSGHSLGGGPVQVMMESLEKNMSFKKNNPDLKLKGYTYGAIGGVSYFWNKLLTASYHAIAHQNLNAFKDLSSFKMIGLSAITEKVKTLIFKEVSHPNIYRYKHAGDLIPKVGSIGYDNYGVVTHLKDYCGDNIQAEVSVGGKKIYCKEEEVFQQLSWMTKAKITLIDRPFNTISKIFTLGYHDMLRYVRNVDTHIKQLSLGNPEISAEQLKELTPHVHQFKAITDKFNKATRIENDGLTQRIFTQQGKMTVSKLEQYQDLNLIVQKMKAMRIASNLSADLLVKPKL